jgi:hypothetical protein
VPRAPAVALAVLVALAGAACSGGGGGDDSAPPLTKTEFIERGDQICRAFDRRVDEATASLADDATRDDVITLIRERLLPLLDAEVDELAELEPPAEDRDRVERFLDDFHAGVTAIRRNTGAFVDARLQESALDRADEAMRDYGFTVCGARESTNSS